jgi:hypothetical protein
LSNLALALEYRGKTGALTKSLEEFYPTDLSAGYLVYGYLYGYSIALDDSDFNSMFANVDKALWEQAPLSKDLANFEEIVLFCYLWAQWQAESAKPSWRRSHLERLENKTGIVPMDALSALSTLILGRELGPLQQGNVPIPFIKTLGNAGRDGSGLGTLQNGKSDLALRLRVQCGRLSELDPTVLYKAFLKAYVAPLRARGRRFSTGLYRSRVQEFVRDFADSHVSLTLSEKAAEDLTRRNKPDPGPRPSSFVPTMLSTPRSSWSGWASFKSTHRRLKQTALEDDIDFQLLAADRRPFSTGSSSFKRRWSLLSSTASQTSPRTSIFSLMEIEPDDIIMQDPERSVNVLATF